VTVTGRGLDVTSPKLIFTDSGKNCYAYSGQMAFSSTETDMLLFTTTADPILATLSPYYSANTGAVTSQDAFFQVYLNDVLINRISCSANESAIIQDYHFIIPPNTTVTITGKNTSGGTELHFFASIRGRTIE